MDTDTTVTTAIDTTTPPTEPTFEPANDSMPHDEYLLAEALAGREYQNQLFRALQPDQKRVTIAKDVLKRLGSGLLVAKPGSYLELSDQVTDVVNGFKCEACAIGGVFACAVERGEGGGTVVYRNLDAWVGEVYMEGAGGPVTFMGSTMVDKLDGLFEAWQLRLMEAAFEGSINTPAVARTEVRAHFSGDYIGASAALDRAYKFHDKLGGGDIFGNKRMAAIMRNVVRNGGEFKP